MPRTIERRSNRSKRVGLFHVSGGIILASFTNSVYFLGFLALSTSHFNFLGFLALSTSYVYFLGILDFLGFARALSQKIDNLMRHFSTSPSVLIA